jgi:hypothetical protein
MVPVTQVIARHVALHALHAGADLDGKPARIKHTLADQGDGLGVLLAAIPLHDHKLAFARCPAHAQQRAEAALFHVRLRPVSPP